MAVTESPCTSSAQFESKSSFEAVVQHWAKARIDGPMQVIARFDEAAKQLIATGGHWLSEGKLSADLKIMYSVLRFIGEEGCTTQQLERIGNLLNVSVPGAYKGPDHVEVRFSVTVSTAETWEAHEAAVISWLRSAEPAVREARLNDMALELDILIEPEDVQGKPYLTMPISRSFQEDLLRSEVALIFTFSNPADFTGDLVGSS